MAVGRAGRNLERALLVPRQRGEARVVAAADLHRQVMPAQQRRDRGGHIGGARQNLGGAVRGLDHLGEQLDALLRRQLAARRDDAARMLLEALRDRGAARGLVAGDAERLADRGEEGGAGGHRVRTRRFHCAWNVCTSGAGKSRCRVQTPASGSQRKRPKSFPDQAEPEHRSDIATA